ncbi:type II TA system antitoxin MqsA family protein [Saccharibacillus brassicae]|uniref:DUF4065 domain-containing protein n=1 Tax=Saccharibacillus brassicae TaxID=2583377 RepID=A0A4Y6URZ9_SACBS|nr:type II TA system antitoxin MqsA family protein [Saccharibacillus brassicae]QDH19540.1 DUF4065 domain-containing protein [Saccharibacillus brassicae]
MNYCEICGTQHNYTIKNESHVFNFRGQKIGVERRVAFCNNCNSLIDVEELENETMAKVVQIYSEQYGMTSLEIKNVRKQFNLGIRPFAKLLNIGSASVSRYESGSLPQATHLEIYKRLKDHPHAILELLNTNKNLLTPRELQMVEKSLQAWSIPKQSFQTDEQIIESIYMHGEGTELTGYNDFSLDKFINMILYFTSNGVLKTKLMKLMWYSDFLFFKRQTISITGTTYVKYPYGPVPKDHDVALAHLQLMNAIEIDELTNDDGWIMMKVRASEPFDSTVFSEEELNTLAEVADFFREYGSIKISDYAHNEKGWSDTEEKQTISYIYAEELHEFVK